jgi:GMP synthase-like glutamine amidotransferase
MRVLVIENYYSTPAGAVGRVLAERGIALDRRQAFAGEPLPEDVAPHEGLIVLGGGQNALDDANYPFMPKVVDLIRRFGAADKPVLGICLGSQLIARAHGAENILGRALEFGWHEVRPTAAGRDDPVLAGLGEGAPLFHWHNDTFTLPPGAVHLAESDMTRNQAFRIGRATYGIQFHFEADRRLVADWSRELADMIAANTPDWPMRLPADMARFGPQADIAGEALAIRWSGLLGG